MGDYYNVKRENDFSEGRRLLDSGSSYLYMRNPDGLELLSGQSFNRPKQYFRRMVAEKTGSDNPDWRTNPCYETLQRTVERLKGRF